MIFEHQSYHILYNHTNNYLREFYNNNSFSLLDKLTIDFIGCQNFDVQMSLLLCILLKTNCFFF